MPPKIRRILRHIRAHKLWDYRFAVVLCACMLCFTYTVFCVMKPTLAYFFTQDSMDNISIIGKWFQGSTTTENGEPVPESFTIRVVAQEDPHLFILNGRGDGTGYCEVTVTPPSTPEGETERTYYISPISSNDTVYLALYARSGATVNFNYCLGSPPEGSKIESPTSVSPASTYASGAEMVNMVYLEDSFTPYEEYTIPERATIEAIAGHYRVSLEDIQVFNELDSVYEAEKLESILIPNPATNTPYAPPQIYKVVSGDTLQKIAQEFHVTIDSLLAWNQLADATSLGVNQDLIIPVLYENVVGAVTPVNEPEAETETTETTGTENTEATGTENTEATGTENTEATGTENAEATGAENTETTGTEKPEATGAENTETTGTEEPEATGAENPETTGTEKPEATGAENPEAAGNENPEAAGTEKTETTGTENTETTENQNTEETGTTETAESDAPEPGVFVEAEDGTLYVQGVPLYFQDDYPKCLYGNGTVASSGCSVTSLTMVANAITGYDYTVDELADYFGGRAESNMARLELGAEKLGLSFHKTEQFYDTWKALKEGKIAIALMEETSKFTNSQHFIVLTGMSEDGTRVYVNDSNKANYGYWDLKNGFEKGFTENELLQGYSGGWVFDRELEEQPARYSEERVDKQIISKYFTGEDGEVLSTNYPEIRLNLEERELLAKVIWAEARGEPAEGQQAIAEVVLNRMISSQFGNTLNDVIYSANQFRSVDQLVKAEPSQAQYQAIDRALFGTPVLNRNVFYFAPYLTNSNTYMQIGKHIFCYQAVEDRPIG